MPVIKCNNNKYKWGNKGKCIYSSKTKAEKAGEAIKIKKYGGKKR